MENYGRHHNAKAPYQLAVWLNRDVQHKNVDKDPDLRKSSDLRPLNRPWVPWVIGALALFGGVVLVVGAGWLALKLFEVIGEDTDASSAGAWASAVGATALAIASVWLAAQANKQAREAEERASDEAALTAKRHKAEMDATQVRHDRELEQANERLNRQIKAEMYREQAQAIRDLWATVNKAILPTLTLAQMIDEHNAFYQKVSSEPLVISTFVSKVSTSYTNWKLHYFDVQAAIEVVEMLVEDKTIRKHVSSLSSLVDSHMEFAKSCKEGAIKTGGGNGVSMFPDHISEFVALRKPMMMEVHRLLTSTDGGPQAG